MASRDVFKSGRPSGSTYRADVYHRSARFRFRNERANNNAPITRFAASLPKLFGRKTFVLWLLARSESIRQVQLHRVIGEDCLQNLVSTEHSGLIVRWGLQRGNGFGVALNPDFPGIALIRKLLRAIQPDAVSAVDLEPLDEHVPSRCRRVVDVDLLFGTVVRTRTLATLEALGGSARFVDLHSSVPGQLQLSVKQVVRYYVAEGILRNDGGCISFATNPWTAILRKLLRKLMKEGLQVRAGIAVRKADKRISMRRYQKFGLFGRSGCQSVLTELATTGPASILRLETITLKSDVTRILRPFERMGIVGSIRGTRRAKIVGLNTAHPIYRALRSLLLATAGAKGRRPRDHEYPAPEGGFEIDALFSTALRLDVLLALAFAPRGEIDGSSMGRLLNEHTQSGMQLRLLWFQEEGLVTSRPWKSTVQFRLDEAYDHHKLLLELLRTIGKSWPDRVKGFPIENILHPPKRQAMELDRDAFQ